MSENKFKIGRSNNGQRGGGSFFSLLEKRVKLETYFEEGFPVKYLPKILFVLFLSLIYISNTHYSEKTLRKINKMQTDVEDVRADYTTLKADLMFASKQSEVARRVRSLGLKESNKPPFKIEVEKGEY
ncbi:MAG TPA: FtsL-like putative cell division protein [Cyclobacteriaceae bacterium]